MSARKSAPVSAGGVNVRRLMLSRVAEMEHKREEEEELEQEDSMELSNECGNPFCRQIMANRYTRFCEDKPMCQRYRALKLQCLANAQAEEDEEDTRPLALVLKWRKEREEKKENEVFAIPRKKIEAPTTGKKKLDLSGERSSSSSPRQKEKKKKKREVEEQEEKEKKQKKRLKRAREAAANNALEAASAAPSRSPSVTSTASSVEEFGTVLERKKRLDDDAPTFSCHEDFLPRLLFVFIHKLPQSLEAVFNVTKKPRKMNWYIKYVERIERLCKPFNLQVKIEGLKATVTVRGREWLTLQGNSTVTLHLEIIKSLRAEAVTWLRFYEEMEKALAHYRGIYGSQANKSYTFLRAWNDLKNPGNYISLSRQANYFCVENWKSSVNVSWGQSGLIREEGNEVQAANRPRATEYAPLQPMAK
ncbi:hypothetical protein JG688_00005586 [Phytophthora aleatoria]|uniref:Uncharacterized protein n=1 Tax=Phytophthora aleatoria TaxID=2496075 RepID=A0A8J5J989_9STRA|nr:hypothetical protein JG688_00005586 [Phytophthora aleatoria]